MVANWHVNMGYWVIPNTMASLFVPAVIYLLLKVRRGASHVSTVVTMLLMGALILTHSLTAAFMALVLFISWLGFKVYDYLYHEWKTPITLTISTLFAVGMFSWWAYASRYLTTLADLMRSGFSVNYFLRPMPRKLFTMLQMYLFLNNCLAIWGFSCSLQYPLLDAYT